MDIRSLVPSDDTRKRKRNEDLIIKDLIDAVDKLCEDILDYMSPTWETKMRFHCSIGFYDKRKPRGSCPWFLEFSQQYQSKFDKFMNRYSRAGIYPKDDLESGKLPGVRCPRFDDEDVYKRYKNFKRFDKVEDHSDHLFASKPIVEETDCWVSRMEYEWKVLKDRLPDTIFVRAYKSRKDLLRAVIIGEKGTPYHDGLFFFDIYFPPNYPSEQPLVRYHSAGLGINPHLFECGEVRMCLVGSMRFRHISLWPPVEISMYGFLVSLRDKVLSAEPFFNQPGFLDSVPAVAAEYLSLLYNENILPKSLTTMIETIRNPPKNFEDFVAGHFRNRMADIIMACRAYREGMQAGGNKGSCSSIKFREVVTTPMLDLGYIYLTHGAREAYHAIKAPPLAKIAPSNDVANIIKEDAVISPRYVTRSRSKKDAAISPCYVTRSRSKKDAVIPPCDVACRRGKKHDVLPPCDVTRRGGKKDAAIPPRDVARRRGKKDDGHTPL